MPFKVFSFTTPNIVLIVIIITIVVLIMMTIVILIIKRKRDDYHHFCNYHQHFIIDIPLHVIIDIIYFTMFYHCHELSLYMHNFHR